MPDYDKAEAAERAIELGERQAQAFADQADPTGRMADRLADRHERTVLAL